jgi:hypothetical protein
MSYTSPRETLAAASQPISEALASRVVFHPYMCGLREGAAMFVAALIGYDDHGGCCWETHEPKTIMIDYFLYNDVRLHWIADLTLLLLLSASSDNDDL